VIAVLVPVSRSCTYYDFALKETVFSWGSQPLCVVHLVFHLWTVRNLGIITVLRIQSRLLAEGCLNACSAACIACGIPLHLAGFAVFSLFWYRPRLPRSCFRSILIEDQLLFAMFRRIKTWVGLLHRFFPWFNHLEQTISLSYFEGFLFKLTVKHCRLFTLLVALFTHGCCFTRLWFPRFCFIHQLWNYGKMRHHLLPFAFLCINFSIIHSHILNYLHFLGNFLLSFPITRFFRIFLTSFLLVTLILYSTISLFFSSRLSNWNIIVTISSNLSHQTLLPWNFLVRSLYYALSFLFLRILNFPRVKHPILVCALFNF